MEKLKYDFNMERVVGNKHSLFKQYCLEKLSEDIYLNILSRKSEEEYYNCNKLLRDTFMNDTELRNECVQIIMKHLEKEGWKTSLSFGGTGLFVYQKEKPRNCFDDTF